jgi:hypothetical protein
MNATAELETPLPPIADHAPATRALAPLSIKATVLAQFTATETDLRALAAKYANVAFNVSTPKGLAEAKAARLELREQGRYLVERAEKRIKGEVNELKAAMSAEVERLVAIVRPHEDAVHAQIVAREEAIAAEKAEAERKAAEAARLEAERRQRLEDGISTIAGYVTKASGKTAAQIAGGLDFVRGLVIDQEHWKDYTERATAALAATLTALEAMHAAQVKAEADAAELEALRAERAERQRREEAASAQAAAETRQRAEVEAAATAAAEAERAARIEAEVAAMLAAMPQPPATPNTTSGAAPQQAPEQPIPEADACAD